MYHQEVAVVTYKRFMKMLVPKPVHADTGCRFPKLRMRVFRDMPEPESETDMCAEIVSSIHRHCG